MGVARKTLKAAGSGDGAGSEGRPFRSGNSSPFEERRNRTGVAHSERSFPYKRFDWSRTHARQPELHRYLEETVEQFGLTPHLRLGTGDDTAIFLGILSNARPRGT